MPYLDLTFSEPSVTYGVGRSLNPGWCIVYQTGLRGWRDSVELASGGDLAKLQGRAFVRVGNAEPEVVGMLHHMAEVPGDADRLMEHHDETYSVEFALTEEQVMALIEAERLGRGASGVKIEVRKLRYGGYDPDGRETEWDNVTDRSIPIRSASFLFGPEPPPEAEPDEPASAPPHPAAIATLALRADLKSALTWIMTMLAILIAVTLFRR